MDWIDGLDDHEIGEDAAFTVLAEGPPPLTSRQQNKTKKSQDNTWQEATHDLTLQAYPKLYPKETEDSRLQRASAFETVWSSIDSRIQSCLESTDAAVYDSLLSLAKLRHPTDGLPTNTPAYGLHRIPTGLVLAGGVNSADHVRTFPNLANYLRSEGCYVALLRPYDFGKSVSDALNAALRQLSGLNETRADTFQALAAWYADELSHNSPTTHAAATTAAVAGTSRVQALNQNVNTTATTTANQINNKQRPLVVIVESTEAVLDTTLSDLVCVLSEGWPQLPITLVLGLNIAASAVPASLTDRALDCYEYNLATAVARLDTLVEKVLLSRWPGLLLDGDVVDILWGHFMKYYFSPGIIVKGWKLAALAHCRGQPLAALAAAAVGNNGGDGGDTDFAFDSNGGDAFIKAMKTAIAALLPAAAAEAKQQLASGGSGGKGNAIATSVTEFIWAWRRWALALKVMVAAASTAGLTNGYTHWQLYESALDPNFSNRPAGKELLGRLERALKKLDENKATELLGKLSLLAKAVQNQKSAHDGADTSGGGNNKKCDLSNEGTELEMEIEALKAKMNGNTEIVDEDAEQGQATVADEEGLTATATAAAPTKKKERDRFFSKKSRKEALLSKAQATGASNKGKRNNARGTFGEGILASQQSLGALLAAWIYPWLSKALRQPPTQLPAAKLFTCRDASSLDCLTAAPREAIHAALTRPQLYLPTLGSTNDNDLAAAAGPSMSKSAFATRAAAQDISLGITANVEDACLAYQLFDQDPSCANVAEWFTAFKAVHDAQDGDANVEKTNNTRGKEQKGAAKGMKAGPGNKKKRKVSVDPAVAAAKAEKNRLLAARFSQATAELQFVGLIKPQKNRSRGDAVQRAVHMPAPLMGDV